MKDIKPFYEKANISLYNEDCIQLMENLPEESFDMIFADPPYMLSNNGTTCKSGKLSSVNKAKWDKSKGFEEDFSFHEKWISQCRRVLKPEGTIWISGTYHSIYQCGFILQKLNFHILNDITWFKTNASPNLSCRFFTASHETILWAKKDKTKKHYFDYQSMKNGSFKEDFIKKPGLQMRSVWSIPSCPPSEKTNGKHPTQKPISLLKRIIKSSTKDGDIIFDPFNGSGTTGVATCLLGNRKYIGCDSDQQYLELTVKRIESMESLK